MPLKWENVPLYTAYLGCGAAAQRLQQQHLNNKYCFSFISGLVSILNFSRQAKLGSYLLYMWVWYINDTSPCCLPTLTNFSSFQKWSHGKNAVTASDNLYPRYSKDNGLIVALFISKLDYMKLYHLNIYFTVMFMRLCQHLTVHEVPSFF